MYLVGSLSTQQRDADTQRPSELEGSENMRSHPSKLKMQKLGLRQEKAAGPTHPSKEKQHFLSPSLNFPSLLSICQATSHTLHGKPGTSCSRKRCPFIHFKSVAI
jgi:hypothetical protein